MLLELKPPLETILTNPHEHLQAERTAKLIKDIRSYSSTEPRRVVLALAEILEKIRNKRAHGFITSDGPQDNEILTASTFIVRTMAEVAAKQLLPLSKRNT
jgi:hypothetical protein